MPKDNIKKKQKTFQIRIESMREINPAQYQIRWAHFHNLQVPTVVVIGKSAEVKN